MKIMTGNKYQIHLSERPVLPWAHHKGVHVCGYAFLDGSLYKGKTFADLILEYGDRPGWQKILDKLNGFFAVICETEHHVLAAVDHIRSIPLFYAEQKGKLYLSDRAEWIQTKLDLRRMDHLSAAEYLATGFVTGSDTLFPELSQLKAGESLITDLREKPPKTGAVRYFEFLRQEINNDTIDQKIEQLHATHLSVFRRLVETLDGRKAIVPLSGGFDSRLIAVMLEEVGYDNIQYISYGKPGNWESRISREIADHFGRPWIFVPESREEWYSWFNSRERLSYASYTDQLSSYAIIQDFPVIWKLKQHNNIPDDGIFIPGHSGGLMSGSHVSSDMLQNPNVTGRYLAEHILSKNYRNWPWENSALPYQQYFENKIRSIVDLPVEMDPGKAADIYENWIWQERQAKYIVPSVMGYEFWGYEWRIPLWDRGMTDFWLQIQADERAGRKLYKNYLDAKIKLPVTEANSPKLSKAWDRYNRLTNPQYGRFNGDRALTGSLLLQLKDFVDFDEMPFDFVNKHIPLYFKNITAVCALKYLEEIKDRTSSSISPEPSGSMSHQ